MVRAPFLMFPAVALSYPPGYPLRNEGMYDLIVLYLEEMIWKVSTMNDLKKKPFMDYVELHCFSFADNMMTCSDGHIDLNRGVIKNGTREFPLRRALFISDGYMVDQKKYRNTGGFYLQVLMRNGKVYLTLVVDDPRLFWSNINQQFLLGNYDQRYFEEVHNNFPQIRLLKVKRGNN